MEKRESENRTFTKNIPATLFIGDPGDGGQLCLFTITNRLLTSMTST